MTNEERQLLEDTARNLLLLLKKCDDAGMSISIVELYRAAVTTPERKLVTIARLNIQIVVMKQKGESVLYLESLVAQLETWSGLATPPTNRK